MTMRAWLICDRPDTLVKYSENTTILTYAGTHRNRKDILSYSLAWLPRSVSVLSMYQKHIESLRVKPFDFPHLPEASSGDSRTLREQMRDGAFITRIVPYPPGHPSTHFRVSLTSRSEERYVMHGLSHEQLLDAMREVGAAPPALLCSCRMGAAYFATVSEKVSTPRKLCRLCEKRATAVTTDVVNVARELIDNGAFSDVAILADMLNEGGLEDEDDLVMHFRGQLPCSHSQHYVAGIMDEEKPCTCEQGIVKKPVPCLPCCWALTTLLHYHELRNR